MTDFFRARTGAPKGAAGPSGAASTAPWVEKYRPRKMEDVAHQDEVVRALQKSIITGNLPHLLFYGPPGTGKTSTILAIARELFGPELARQRVLELNASDERGIKVVREKVKAFASVSAGDAVKGYPCPPYKIIVLDEADSMTPDAQAALRRTMEDHSRSTRFCIICNYVSRIIEPLTSRCAKFRFRPLEQDAMRARLRYICQQEGLDASDETLDGLARCSEGDLRKAITYLQGASRLHGSNVTMAEITDVAGLLSPDVIARLTTACRSNSYDQLQVVVTDLVASGYSASQVLQQIADAVLRDPGLNEPARTRLGLLVAAADKALVDGADEFLQLLALAGHLMTELCAAP
jgi:replication factor C subunit 2/4